MKLLSQKLSNLEAGKDLFFTPSSFRAIAERLEQDEVSAVGLSLAIDLLEDEAGKICPNCRRVDRD